MAISYAIVLAILGFLAIFLTQVFARGKDAAGIRKTWFWIGMIGLVPGLIALASPSTIPFLQTEIGLGGGALSAGTGISLPDKPSSVICAVEDTTVTLSSNNKYTATSTGGTHRYRINGAPAQTVSDAGTLTASPGDTLQILWGNETIGNYFGSVSNEVIPCVGTKTFTTDLVQNGTLTVEVFNEEGNLIDTVQENETLAAGDVVTLSARLKGTYQRGFPYGGVMVVEFNGTGSSSQIDDVILSFGGSETSVPSIYSITLGTFARTKAYTIPSIISNQILDGSIVIDADDTNNPGSAGDPLLTFYPNDYFINEDTGGSFDGPSADDEDDAQTFPHITTFTINVD